MLKLSLTNLAQLGLTHAITAGYHQTAQTTPLNQQNMEAAYRGLRAIGAGDFLGHFKGPLAREIQTHGIEAAPEDGLNAENYVLENFLRLGCLMYALLSGISIREAATQLQVTLPEDSSSFSVAACSTLPPAMEAVMKHTLAFSSILKAVGLDVVVDHLISQGSSQEEALHYLAGKDVHVLYELDGSDKGHGSNT